tara:strand:- start:42 stop:809 length:768 start_codon:yes stop_codon:yes gene_type:complete
MGTGIIGKILSKKQHMYSSGEDKNADANPGYTQWRNDNKKQDDNAATLAEFKKIQADKKGNAKEADSVLNMNSPLNSYANPRFVDTEAGQKAEVMASKIMLDGAVKKFNEPGRKADRQKKRSDRKIKRADAREVRQKEKFKSGTNRSDNDSYGLIGQLPKSVKKSRYEKKTEKLRTDAKSLSLKSDANKMIAAEKNMYAGMTKNQIFKQKELDRKNKANKVSQFAFKNQLANLKNLKTTLTMPTMFGGLTNKKRP